MKEGVFLCFDMCAGLATGVALGADKPEQKSDAS